MDDGSVTRLREYQCGLSFLTDWYFRITMKKQIHVAVGVIFDCPQNSANNGTGHILIAKRADHQHQGGFWEFPGGKVEEGESVQIALQRELEEELGLTSSIDDMAPIMTIPFEYPDKSILLDVWAVYNVSNLLLEEVGNSDFRGKEDQPLAWVKQADIAEYEFPPANQPIIETLLASIQKHD